MTHPTNNPNYATKTVGNIQISAAMLRYLTDLSTGGVSFVPSRTASYFRRHELAVRAEGVPVTKRGHVVMGITQKGLDTFAALKGGAA